MTVSRLFFLALPILALGACERRHDATPSKTEVIIREITPPAAARPEGERHDDAARPDPDGREGAADPDRPAAARRDIDPPDVGH